MVGKFNKVVSGIIMSPALGDDFLDYEKTLSKRYKLQKISLALIVSLILVNLLVPVFSIYQNNSQTLSKDSVQIKNRNFFELSSLTDYKNNSAQPGDKITFRLFATNTSNVSRSISPQNDISDILEYADITDTNGATIENHTLIWPELDILPGETYEASFEATILDAIPHIGRSTPDRLSYDCQISNQFGNQIDIKISCPFYKNVDIFTTNLPYINVFLTTIILIAILTVQFMSTWRTNILLRQLKFIRRNKL